MIQVTFHGLSPSEAVTEAIERQANHLTRLAPAVTRIRAVVEVPHHRHRHGNHFRVLLDVTLPTGEIIVGRDQAARIDDEDVYVAIRHAFEIAARQLTTGRRRRSGKERGRGPGAPALVG